MLVLGLPGYEPSSPYVQDTFLAASAFGAHGMVLSIVRLNGVDNASGPASSLPVGGSWSGITSDLPVQLWP